MDLVVTFTCDCKSGFNWKNKNTYMAHKKSMRHISYEKNLQEKEHRKNITILQIRNDKLERENKQLRELYLYCAKENMDLKQLNELSI